MLNLFPLFIETLQKIETSKKHIIHYMGLLVVFLTHGSVCQNNCRFSHNWTDFRFSLSVYMCVCVCMYVYECLRVCTCNNVYLIDFVISIRLLPNLVYTIQVGLVKSQVQLKDGLCGFHTCPQRALPKYQIYVKFE